MTRQHRHGYDGFCAFLGARRTVFTGSIFNRSTRGISLLDASTVLGCAAIEQATQATAPGFGGELSRHPGEVVVAVGEIIIALMRAGVLGETYEAYELPKSILDVGGGAADLTYGLTHISQRFQTLILVVAAAFCLRELVAAPKHAEPGPGLVAVFGFILLTRAIIQVRQPAVAVLSGCSLAAFLIASNHGMLNIDNPIWIAIMLVGMACFGFWEKIEKLWNRE